MSTEKPKHDGDRNEIDKMIDRKTTAILDARRGMPVSRVIDIWEAQSEISRILLESNPDMKEPIERLKQIREEWIDEMRENSRVIPDIDFFPEPPSAGIVRVYPSTLQDRIALEPEPIITDFKLLFIGGSSSGDFKDAPSPQGVFYGMFGWGFQSRPPHEPYVKSKENGHKEGKLEFLWSATIPYDGIFTLNPRAKFSNAFIIYKYKIEGPIVPTLATGAGVEINYFTAVTLDQDSIGGLYSPLFDETTLNFEKKGRGYASPAMPGKITFQATEGQQLEMRLRLSVNVFARKRDQCLARIKIKQFAIPAVSREDLDLPVTS